MLVTSLYRWLYDGDWFQMLVTWVQSLRFSTTHFVINVRQQHQCKPFKIELPTPNKVDLISDIRYVTYLMSHNHCGPKLMGSWFYQISKTIFSNISYLLGNSCSTIDWANSSWNNIRWFGSNANNFAFHWSEENISRTCCLSHFSKLQKIYKLIWF